MDLDTEGVFSMAADLGGVAFVSPDRSQLTSTVGPVWSALPWLDVSASALIGFLAGGDLYGAFLTVSPKVPLF